MSSFEKLLDTVKNANLISEQEATAMLDDYNATQQQAIDSAVNAATGSAFKDGYDQGFTNAKQQADVEFKQKTDELLAKCDEDATNKLNAIVDMINNDHAEKIQQIYDLMKQNYVPAKELEEMDADHAKKFQEVLEAADSNYAKKLKIACECVKNNAKKYISAREKFHKEKFNLYKESVANELATAKRLLTEERSRKMSVMTAAVDKYLDYALTKSMPTKKFISEAKYDAQQKALDKIASILKINTILQESKDGIFKDFENKINSAKADTNKLMAENVELKAQLNKQEAKLMLESKLTKCTPAEADFLRSYFRNASSSKIIEEQIEDARSAFNKIHNERRSSLVNSSKASVRPSSIVNESKTTAAKEPKMAIVEESKNNVSEMSIGDYYANMIKKQN